MALMVWPWSSSQNGPNRNTRSAPPPPPKWLVTVLDTAPLKPWITLALEMVAQFRYPAKCLSHECLGTLTAAPL